METRETKDRNAALTREHLANERTFRAWQRTAIAMMGFGIVIAKLKRSIIAEGNSSSGTINEWHLGSFLVLAALLASVMAAWRYFKAQKSIESGAYAPNNAGIAISAAICALAAALMLVFLLTTGSKG